MGLVYTRLFSHTHQSCRNYCQGDIVYSNKTFFYDCKKKRYSYGVKLNIAVKGQICHGGSKILEKWRSPYNAECLRGLSDYTFVKMLELDEFGSGSSGSNTVWIPPVNPVNPKIPVGGSSSGAPVAIVEKTIDFAIVTDTGGSARLPAIQCNIVGFKPSYGVISRFGVMPLSHTLDCVSIMCDKVNLRALEKFYMALQKNKKLDQTATSILHPLPTAPIRCQLIQPDSKIYGINWEKFVEILKLVHEMYYQITDPQFASNILRYDGTRHNPDNISNHNYSENLRRKKDLMTAETYGRFTRGLKILKQPKKTKVKQKITQFFSDIFNSCDIFAFKIPASKTPGKYDHYYSFCNILNYPAIVLDGIQYVANTNCDLKLLKYLCKKI